MRGSKKCLQSILLEILSSTSFGVTWLLDNCFIYFLFFIFIRLGAVSYIDGSWDAELGWSRFQQLAYCASRAIPMNLEVSYSLGTEMFLDAFSHLLVVRSKGQELIGYTGTKFTWKNKSLRLKTRQSLKFIIDGGVLDCFHQMDRYNFRRGTQQRKRNTSRTKHCNISL